MTVLETLLKIEKEKSKKIPELKTPLRKYKDEMMQAVKQLQNKNISIETYSVLISNIEKECMEYEINVIKGAFWDGTRNGINNEKLRINAESYFELNYTQTKTKK